MEFPLGFDELNFYNAEIKRTVEPTTYKIWVGGSSLATAETSLSGFLVFWLTTCRRKALPAFPRQDGEEHTIVLEK